VKENLASEVDAVAAVNVDAAASVDAGAVVNVDVVVKPDAAVNVDAVVKLVGKADLVVARQGLLRPARERVAHDAPSSY
jgi:hypothetical protein